MKARYLLLTFVLFAFISCSNEPAKIIDAPVSIAESSIDETLADSLFSFFNDDYFFSDSTFLKGDSIPYQFYKVDLNDDGEEEIFVRFMDPYFCGTGGCTFLILDQNFTVTNKFTVMNAPIVVSHEIKNGWNVLLTNSDGELKEIVNKNDRYPSNPTMTPTSSIMIHVDDIRMFDDELHPSKTYYF